MYTPNDKYTQKAHYLGYRARSVFKLEEIDTKYQIIKPGMNILDLGSAPGSWLQYVADKVGPAGKVYGLDLQEIEPLDKKNVTIFKADIYDDDFLATTFKGKLFDAIISDMAPSTSGIKITDSALSLELLDRALQISKIYLNPGGHFVSKIFEGEDLNLWFSRFKKYFKMSKRFKPHASREESKELFIIGKGFKKPA